MASDTRPAMPDSYTRAWEKFRDDPMHDGTPLTPEKERGLEYVFLSGYAMGCTATRAELAGDKLRGVKGGQGRSAGSLVKTGWAMLVFGMLGLAAVFGILLARV